MNIVLIRHGETALNAARVLQPADTPLSERGHLQAQALARHLAGERAGAILTSDLPRALQTARTIAAAARLDIHQSALLRERNFGELRGRAYAQFDFDPLGLEQAPLNGESMAAFHARVGEALAYMSEQAARFGQQVIVVTHGLVIHAVLERHAVLAPAFSLPPRIDNASVSSIAAQPPHQAQRINCTAHLGAASGEARDAASA
jgi:2,3-bisphosphoglycerate-dependent phosphoglycerate mutase